MVCVNGVIGVLCVSQNCIGIACAKVVWWGKLTLSIAFRLTSFVNRFNIFNNIVCCQSKFIFWTQMNHKRLAKMAILAIIAITAIMTIMAIMEEVLLLNYSRKIKWIFKTRFGCWFAFEIIPKIASEVVLPITKFWINLNPFPNSYGRPISILALTNGCSSTSICCRIPIRSNPLSSLNNEYKLKMNERNSCFVRSEAIVLTYTLVS